MKTIFINDIFTNPEIHYSQYKKIAVLEFHQSIEIIPTGLDKIFTELAEEELIKEGYDIVTSDKFDSLLERLIPSSEDLGEIEYFHLIKNKLNVSAIIKGSIDYFHVESKTKQVTARDVTIRQEPDILHYTSDIRSYISNISLNMHMIELQEGSIIWACSISFEDHKSDENGRELSKKIIKRCLATIPKT